MFRAAAIQALSCEFKSTELPPSKHNPGNSTLCGLRCNKQCLAALPPKHVQAPKVVQTTTADTTTDKICDCYGQEVGALLDTHMSTTVTLVELNSNSWASNKKSELFLARWYRS